MPVARRLDCSDVPPLPGTQLDVSLREYLKTNRDLLTRVAKPVSLRDIGCLSAQSAYPILFENIVECPGFRLCDMLVRNRTTQGRALGVSSKDFLKTLAYRLRQPPRGLVTRSSGPVKEVKWIGGQADLTRLPIPFHTEGEEHPYLTAMNIIRDPETGYFNSSHAGTTVLGPRRALISFANQHSHRIMRKYRAMGADRMPIVIVAGVPPAYEIMANYSGLHLDMWGEMDMVGTIMDQDIEITACETIDLSVPAHAEIAIEGYVDLKETFDAGEITAPSMYRLPHSDYIPALEVTAITMREDRPIYRNHQACPDTDHQTLPRLCHEAVLYNRLREMGLEVVDVRFPSWGAALSCIIQIDYPHFGFVNDALMMTMGAPWLNTKLVVAISPDTDIDSPADVYHALATRVDPQRDVIIVGNTRGSPYDPSAAPIDGAFPFRVAGKMGVDATVKTRHGAGDFTRAWPMNWGKVFLNDYLDPA